MHKYLFLLFFLAVIACGEQKEPVAEPPEVFVITASEQSYRPSRTYNARIQSRSDIDITAQVSGKLIGIHFKEGDSIKKGDLLFAIDPAPFEASLAQAEAEFKKADAISQNAAKNLERGEKMVNEGIISASQFDELNKRALEAAAQLEAATAAVDKAKIDLGYTKITAPQDGRIGQSKPEIGELISPESGTLTTLVGQDDMEVVFQLPERLIMTVKRPDAKISFDEIVVSVQLEDGAEYPHTARIDYFSNRVDPTTGTVEARAPVANPDYILRPGMFVTAILRLEKPLQSLVVPQAAVQVDQQGAYVLVVDTNDKVARKNIITDDRIGENVLVPSGLDSGERVIVRGVQKARPGDKVQVSDFVPATSPNEGNNQ